MGEIIYPVREKIIDKMVIDGGDAKHSIIKVNDSDEWMRERAEMVMLRVHSGKTETFLQKKEMYGGILKFKLPGGSVNDNESFEDAAIRECQEEALATVDKGSIVGNRNTFDYIVKCDKCHPWVEKIFLKSIAGNRIIQKCTQHTIQMNTQGSLTMLTKTISQMKASGMHYLQRLLVY